MDFRTIVDIPKPNFEIQPCEEMLFVGSCFANEIGHRFQENGFPVVVNPYGTMYNPASILHTVERLFADSPNAQSPKFQTVFLTLGTNHVYRLKETGEIVDNCQKRPQTFFIEEELSVDDCADYLEQTIELLRQMNPDVQVVLTVSPIRYRKYGYHGSQLSKATLLLAADKVCGSNPAVCYFPAYEIVNDELRDYRFYQADMLHPSDQTVEYIWQRLTETWLSEEALVFLKEWAPLKAVLNHKPFHPDSKEYQALMDKTMLKVQELQKKYPNFAL